MTQAQGDTVVQALTAMQTQQADIALRLAAVGRICGLLCWLMLAAVLLLALHRSIRA